VSLDVRPRDAPWWRAQREILTRWMAGALAGVPAGPVLKTDLFDEASGPYHHADGLPARLAFVGVDEDLSVVRQARQRLGARLGAACVVGDVRRLPFADNSMSAVVSLSTLDHFAAVAEIVASVAELHRVLAPGGRLILTLDNPRNPEVALRSRLPEAVRRRLRADTFPLGRTLGAEPGRRVLREAGLFVEREDYLVHAVRYPAIRLLRWLERRSPACARRVERAVEMAERLRRLPTRSLTGHYVGWIATKPPAA
jgi:SAM-dependent methyltransferase